MRRKYVNLKATAENLIESTTMAKLTFNSLIPKIFVGKRKQVDSCLMKKRAEKWRNFSKKKKLDLPTVKFLLKSSHSRSVIF